jgi:hypothetical protein
MSDNPSTAHQQAVQAIADARQNTRQHVFLMERSDRVRDDAVFVNPDDPEHPQKAAHASVLDYQREIGQPEYTVRMDDTWTEPLTDKRGDEIEITVPQDDHLTKTIPPDADQTNVLPDLSEVDTTTETVSLERLAWDWSGRRVDVTVERESPYYNDTGETHSVRLWLPPNAIKAAYDQLNSALSKIGLLAQTTAPVEHDPDPI